MNSFFSLFAAENMYSITFFCEFNQQSLEEKLKPIGYKSVNNQLVYKTAGDSKKLTIRPFQQNAEGNYGYILFYTDDHEALSKLLQYTFSCIPIMIVNCELKVINGQTQKSNIALANSLSVLSKGSMIGIYDYSTIGVLCLPDDSIVYQQRLKNPSLDKMRTCLMKFNEAANLFEPQKHNLFTASFN